ncbi:MAG: SseB family protein [Ruminococcus sp.]|nr:SseB family protein [Ruminococcus sp.]
MANINLTMKKVDLGEIDNTPLVEAIKEMRANFTPDTQNKVINLALRATFFVPAIIGNKTELVQGEDKKMKFQERPDNAKFLLISNPERGNFFPAYTDRELLKGFKTDQKYQAFAMKFSDLANMSEITPNVNGFIVNPDTEKLPFTMDILANIKKAISDARKKSEEAKAEASAEGAPNITVTTNDKPEE